MTVPPVKVVAAVIIGALMCALVGACGRPAPEPVLEPVLDFSQDVNGSEVTLTGTLVTSECFSFEVPDVGYQLQPDAQSCQAVINFDGGDVLTSIRVAAATGHGRAEDYFREFIKAGDENVTMTQTVVGGVDAHLITWTDSFGLESSMYHVPLAPGLDASGVPVTHVTISGYSYGEMSTRSLGPVVDSFKPAR